MGPQQILRAAAAVLSLFGVALAAPMHGKDRVAVVDLGPADDGAARRQLATAIVAGGLEPVIGDGVEDALAGIAVDRDGVQLAAALAVAGRAFGELDCKRATRAALDAVAIAAAREAAG